MKQSIQLAIVSGLLLVSCSGPKKNHIQPIAYGIVQDRMDTIVCISVPQHISEDELRATLSRAADDHQDDSGRDYLFADFLRVEAYLRSPDGRLTRTRAGRIIRILPDGNVTERRSVPASERRKKDSYVIDLKAATDFQQWEPAKSPCAPGGTGEAPR
jgi:hypothetical protein